MAAARVVTPTTRRGIVPEDRRKREAVVEIVAPCLRIARPSRDPEAAAAFYAGAFGFDVLATFTDHAGIDGVILGHVGWPYHLEFTRRRGDPAVPRPTDEDLLVFYLPDRSGWRTAVQRVRDAGAPVVRSSNPWWNERGVTFEDPDGYRIVLENAPWP